MPNSQTELGWFRTVDRDGLLRGGPGVETAAHVGVIGYYLASCNTTIVVAVALSRDLPSNSHRQEALSTDSVVLLRGGNFRNISVGGPVRKHRMNYFFKRPDPSLPHYR